MIFILGILSVAVHALPPDASELLKSLKVNPAMVKVDIELDEPHDEGAEMYNAIIDVESAINFLGIDLPKGSQVLYEVPGGIRLISGLDSDTVIDGFACSREARFSQNQLCRCDLGKAAKVSGGLELPEGMTVGVRQKKVIWFKSAEATTVFLKGKSGTKKFELHPGWTYSVKNSAISRYQGQSENYHSCGFLDRDP